MVMVQGKKMIAKNNKIDMRIPRNVIDKSEDNYCIAALYVYASLFSEETDDGKWNVDVSIRDFQKFFKVRGYHDDIVEALDYLSEQGILSKIRGSDETMLTYSFADKVDQPKYNYTQLNSFEFNHMYDNCRDNLLPLLYCYLLLKRKYSIAKNTYNFEFSENCGYVGFPFDNKPFWEDLIEKLEKIGMLRLSPDAEYYEITYRGGNTFSTHESPLLKLLCAEPEPSSEYSFTF